MMVIAATTIIEHRVFAQNQPKFTIVNSKHLTIKDPRFRNENFANSITGTIINNSTQEISSASAYALLYDKNNQLITVESGLADVSTLKPKEDSAFKISLFGMGSDTVDHYTLLPGGSIG